MSARHPIAGILTDEDLREIKSLLLGQTGKILKGALLIWLALVIIGLIFDRGMVAGMITLIGALGVLPIGLIHLISWLKTRPVWSDPLLLKATVTETTQDTSISHKFSHFYSAYSLTATDLEGRSYHARTTIDDTIRATGVKQNDTLDLVVARNSQSPMAAIRFPKQNWQPATLKTRR